MQRRIWVRCGIANHRSKLTLRRPPLLCLHQLPIECSPITGVDSLAPLRQIAHLGRKEGGEALVYEVGCRVDPLLGCEGVRS